QSVKSDIEVFSLQFSLDLFNKLHRSKDTVEGLVPVNCELSLLGARIKCCRQEIGLRRDVINNSAKRACRKHYNGSTDVVEVCLILCTTKCNVQTDGMIGYTITEGFRANERNGHVGFVADADTKVIVMHRAFVRSYDCVNIRRTSNIDLERRRETCCRSAGDTRCRICKVEN